MPEDERDAVFEGALKVIERTGVREVQFRYSDDEQPTVGPHPRSSTWAHLDDEG
jgi:hypothetical protein